MDDMDAGFLDRADFESLGMRMEFHSEERNINRKGHGRGEKTARQRYPRNAYEVNPSSCKYLATSLCPRSCAKASAVLPSSVRA